MSSIYSVFVTYYVYQFLSRLEVQFEEILEPLSCSNDIISAREVLLARHCEENTLRKKLVFHFTIKRISSRKTGAAYTQLFHDQQVFSNDFLGSVYCAIQRGSWVQYKCIPIITNIMKLIANENNTRIQRRGKKCLLLHGRNLKAKLVQICLKVQQMIKWQ